MIGFIIPVLNNFKGCTETIASIKTKHSYKIYIQDQWRIQEPLARAWNNGFHQAKNDGCEYIFIINDDILFSPNCIDNMISELERLESKKVIMVTGCNNKGQFDNPEGVLLQKIPDEPGNIADHPDFSCFVVKPNFFDKVGTFDENYIPAWFEDGDMHYRIGLMGYRAVSSTSCSMVHIGRVTTELIGEAADSSISKSYFIGKWGGEPGNEKFTHPYNDLTLTQRDWR